MALVRIDDVAAHGIITDIAPYELPPGAWSQGVNVRFKDRKVQKFLGHSAVFGAPSITPYTLFSVQTLTQAYWIYAGLTKVYGTDMTSHFNLTRQTAGVDVNYGATEERKWNGGVLNGIPILNNGVDEPQMWNPVSSGQRLQLLSNWSTWPGGVSTRARVIRPAFRYFLIALGITEGGVENPHNVAWAQPADPGAVPTSWNYSSATLDTGITPVADTPGSLLDLVMLGDVGVLYKDDSSYVMQFVGGQSIFRITPTPLKFGLLATDCAKPLPGFHFMATQDDIVVHDSRQARSVVTERVRQIVFDNIDNTYKGRSYVVANYRKSEMWFCYPESGQSQPTKALVWNWENNTTTFRELGALTPHIAPGVVQTNVGAQDWDADSGTWDSDSTLWDQRFFDPANTSLLIARSQATAALYLADSTNQFAGANMTSYVERSGITIVGRDYRGEPKIDPDSIKLVKRILPRISGGPVQVYVGAQSLKDGAISWSSAMTFDPTTKNELQCYSVSRFPAVRFESVSDVHWSLDGYELDIELAGKF